MTASLSGHQASGPGTSELGSWQDSTGASCGGRHATGALGWQGGSGGGGCSGALAATRCCMVHVILTGEGGRLTRWARGGGGLPGHLDKQQQLAVQRLHENAVHAAAASLLADAHVGG